MELETAVEKVKAVQEQIVRARAGLCEYPSKEEIKDALTLLRQGRSAASREDKPAKASKSKQIDLASLFGTPADGNGES